MRVLFTNSTFMTTSSESQSLDLLEDYNEFVSSELADGIPSYNIPDYEEFVDIRAKMSDKDDLLKFVTPTSAGSFIAASISNNPAINRIARSAIDAGVSGVSQEGQRVAERIAEQLRSGTPFVKIKKMFGDTGGNSGNSAGGDGTPGNPFNPNRMNYNPKPVQVRLDTGLRSKGYGDYYPESRDALNVLELTAVEFGIPLNAGSVLKGYFDTVIAFNFQNDAQMSVSFNVDASNKFSADNLRNWMNKYSSAYSKFVMYTSIINYCNEPLQQNAGIRALRAMITPTLMDDLNQLGNMLDGTPVPPKFRELIHFIYGAPFKVSNNPGSQIRMIMATPLVAVTEGSETYLGAFPAADIQTAITDLFSVRDTTALIARVCPSWIPGKGNTAAGAVVPEYSPNWHTLFENLPWHMTTANGAQRWGPEIATEIEDGVYGSSADILDGAITALWNGYAPTFGSSAADRFRPGTFLPLPSAYPQISNPNATAYANRLGYVYNDSTGVSRFTPVGINTQDAYSRCETYTLTSGNTIHKVIWPGREIINNINVASARQTCYEMYSMMFEMPSSPKPKFLGGKDDSSGRKGRGSRRGRGSKKNDKKEES